MRIWVNFRELRSKLKFEDVLRHYNVEVKRKGDQHQGFCPLPKHEGKRNSPSFSANLERGIFQCFGCGAKGNVLDFACLMSGHDPTDGDALRSVAVELQEQFVPKEPSPGKMPPPKPEAEMSKSVLPVVVNAPLDFELKGLESGHEYLAKRGFTSETMRHFGVGFCSRGILKDRIAIPLHDVAGKLLGFAGRVIDDALITDDNPRYRFPSRRERGGTIYEFRKSLFLYNGHRQKIGDDDLTVVEGFPSVWWLTQHGHSRVVATMGADCSAEQADLIVSLVTPNGRVRIIPDGDKAGERYAHALFDLIAPRRPVRWVKLAEGRQPTSLSAQEIKTCFTS